MRILLAVLCTALLATPASAETGPMLAHGTLDGAPAAYLGCVHLPPDTTTSYCFAAVAEGGATSITTLVSPPSGPAVVGHVTRDASALRTGTYGIRSTVRLVADLPGIGDVDLTSYSDTGLSRYVTNDLCTPSPVHVELAAAQPAVSLVAWTTGTVGRASAENLHGCASALAVGQVSGAWRMASGL